MNRPFVSLRPEITRAHAQILMNWMGDERVTRYLNDPGNVCHFIGQAIDRAQLPILTHLFNRGGRFFMIYDREDRPVGFVRLVKSGRDCEIVLAIGDHENWGRRLGSSAIREAMKLAFFDMRAEAVIAKIRLDNARSLGVFEGCGFVASSATPTLNALSMTAGRYRRLLREGALAEASTICVTEIDQARLQELIALHDGPSIVELEHELERAIVVSPGRIAEDVVTMNSKVSLDIDEEEREVSLVYPNHADEGAGKMSVLSQIGAAILGYREGDTIDWVVSQRTRRIRIEKLIYQPESRGDLHL